MRLKEEMAQVVSITKETLQQEKEAQRISNYNVVQKAKRDISIAKDECKATKEDCKATAKMLRYKCKETKDTLSEKHQLEVSSILYEQAKIVTGVKDKAKDTVKP